MLNAQDHCWRLLWTIQHSVLDQRWRKVCAWSCPNPCVQEIDRFFIQWSFFRNYWRRSLSDPVVFFCQKRKKEKSFIRSKWKCTYTDLDCQMLLIMWELQIWIGTFGDANFRILISRNFFNVTHQKLWEKLGEISYPQSTRDKKRVIWREKKLGVFALNS
jgi:hypothetical protein